MQACASKGTPTAEHVTLYLDDDVLSALQATGEDWEVRFNAILRGWLHEGCAAA